jgi:two-component system phosphate regulon sensor histidine kinase PhoR
MAYHTTDTSGAQDNLPQNPPQKQTTPPSEQQIYCILKEQDIRLRSQPRLEAAELTAVAAQLDKVRHLLEQSERSRYQELRYVWHALSNAAFVVDGHTGMLRSSLNMPSPSQQEVIDTLQKEANLIHTLSAELERLLTYHREADKSRLRYTKETFDLALLIEEILPRCTEWAKKRHSTIRLREIPQHDLYIYANRERIHFVLTQLIENALRYVPTDGTGTIDLYIKTDKYHVSIQVSDNGQGIKEEHHERVFETSFRDPEKGQTGQGLPIVKNIVREHEGKITLKSTMGAGATFYIELPLTAPPQDKKKSVVTNKLMQLYSKRTKRYYNAELSFLLGRNRAYHARDDEDNAYWIKQAINHDREEFYNLSYEAGMLSGEAVKKPGLEHPALLRMIDWGKQDEAEGMQTRFIVFEPARGKPLHLLVEAEPLMEISWVISIAQHLAELMAYCHDQGIIWRTISPAMIYTDKDSNRTTLVDLSAARNEMHVSKTNDMLGQPCYISPEQINGTPPGRRSDMYVFGVLLLELLTGEQPFTSTIDHISVEPKDPRAVRQDVPDALVDIVMRCLHKWPTERYTEARYLVQELYSLTKR